MKGNQMNSTTHCDITEQANDGIVRGKWALDGAATLTEAAQKARDLADHLQGLHEQGYVLREPVADDYGAYYRP